MHHDNIRKSIEQRSADADQKKSGSGLGYERPWRKAMAKGGKTIEQGASDPLKGRAGSEVPGSPQPYVNLKKVNRSGQTPITVQR